MFLFIKLLWSLVTYTDDICWCADDGDSSVTSSTPDSDL